jgi:hypothetical protein
MDLGGKTSHFQGFKGFIQTQSKNGFSNIVGTFLENTLFVLWLTLIMDLVDPGTFSEIFKLMTVSECFKRIQISCKGSKVPYWQFFTFCKVALLNPCKKFKYRVASFFAI